MKSSTLAAGALRSTLLAALVAVLVPGMPGTALGGDPSTSPPTSGQIAAQNTRGSTNQDDTGHDTTGQGNADQSNASKDSAVVVPYQKRPAPSYRVSLTDGRLFFLTSLEETDTGYVLHTLEGEVIKVDRSEVEKIVKLEKGE